VSEPWLPQAKREQGNGLMLGALTLARLASKYDRPGWEIGL
jgi:hypothetical protein